MSPIQFRSKAAKLSFDGVLFILLIVPNVCWAKWNLIRNPGGVNAIELKFIKGDVYPINYNVEGGFLRIPKYFVLGADGQIAGAVDNFKRRGEVGFLLSDGAINKYMQTVSYQSGPV